MPVRMPVARVVGMCMAGIVRMCIATLRYAGGRGRVSASIGGASLGDGSRGLAGTRRTVAAHVGTTTVLRLLLSCACGVVHTLTIGSHIPYWQLTENKDGEPERLAIGGRNMGSPLNRFQIQNP